MNPGSSGSKCAGKTVQPNSNRTSAHLLSAVSPVASILELGAKKSSKKRIRDGGNGQN